MDTKDRNEHDEHLENAAGDSPSGGISPGSEGAARQADQVRMDELWLAGRMDVDVPDDVLVRVGKRMGEALQHRRRGHRRLWAMAISAAAAVVMAAILLQSIGGPPAGQTTRPTDGELVSVDLVIPDEKMLVMFVELTLADAADPGVELDTIEEDIEAFWQEATQDDWQFDLDL